MVLSIDALTEGKMKHDRSIIIVITGFVALALATGWEARGAAAGTDADDAPLSALTSIRRGWRGVTSLAEHDVLAVAIGKPAKKGKAEVVFAAAGHPPISLGTRPKGKLTASIAPFLGYEEIYDVRITSTIETARNNSSATSIHLVRVASGAARAVCLMPGNSSVEALPPKCGPVRRESFEIVAVDGTDVPTFDVTFSFEGSRSKRTASGKCEEPPEPHRPPPTTERWELPADGKCRVISP